MSRLQHQLKEETSVAELESRKGLYRFFQYVFYKELDQSMLHQLRKAELAGVCNLLGLNSTELNEANPANLEKLAVEFTRLFIGPGKHISPHESVQRKTGGMLNNKFTAEVRRFYAVSGYQFKSDMGIYPDHLCTQMEFMDSLINIQINAIKSGDICEAESAEMLQVEFIRLHLSLWLPEFCEQIIQQSSSSFYRKLAKSLSEFIKMETQELTC